VVIRLDFSVPEFTQIVWVSPEARAIWEKRISDISRAWIYFERLAVSQDLKPLALQHCDPKELPTLMRACSDLGLTVIPLRQEAMASTTYGNAAMQFVEGKPWVYRIVIGNEDKVYEFMQAWDSNDDRKIGEALGFPSCCQEFFYRNWVVDHWRDLTYPMVRDTFGDATHYRVSGPGACNILLRWLGVRMVSHLPCNFQCEKTAQMADELMQTFTEYYPNESNWMRQMLEWPIRWDSLHGIAIISTPVLKIVTSSDPLSERVIVDRNGMVYPSEGASGNQFPFKVISPVRFYKSEDETNYSDNGFSSRDTMNKAHSFVIKMVKSIDERLTSIIDLGCGNASLLQKLGIIYPEAQLIGVEIDAGRYNRANARLSRGKVLHSGIVNLIPIVSGDLIMISVNRLLEMGDDTRNEFFETAGPDVKYILIYSYGENNLLDSRLGWLSNFEEYQHVVDGSNEVIILKKVTQDALR